ncbi:MAG: GbsR/MarR family transcriptional regulator [Rhodothermales bacterium]
MELTEDLQSFVERMGLAMERSGASRTFGRILGLLIFAEEPLSLNEMADILRVSKASVSTNARLCEQTGLLLRISIPGDRRTYYEILPGAFEISLTHSLYRLKEMVDVAEDGLAALNETHPKARSRLEEMHDLYTFLGEGMATALAQWKELKKKKSS